MPTVAIAAFLAGALLSLLLPTLLLTALAVWYTWFVRRAPGPPDRADAPAASAAGGSASAATADAPAPPGER